MIPYFFSDISTIPGVTDRLKNIISDVINGYRIVDLLLHIPYKIIDRSINENIKSAIIGEVSTFILQAIEHDNMYNQYKKNNKRPYNIKCISESGEEVIVSFFNARSGYIKKLFPIGIKKIVSGKTQSFRNKIQIVNPDKIMSVTNLPMYKTIAKEPLYRACVGVSSKKIWSYITYIINSLPIISEWIPHEYLKKYNLPNFLDSLKIIHLNHSINSNYSYENALNRLIFDEALSYQIRLKRWKNNCLLKKKPYKINTSRVLYSKIINKINFSLTLSQKNAFDDITKDQCRSNPMLRLLQGDVGCGKTIVSLLAICNAVESGYQASIMVPTSILAYQHFSYIRNILEGCGLNIALLTGKTPLNERTLLIKKLYSGDIQILIGTHALFTQDIKFKNLALVIIDEQHRFGVNQRKELINKSEGVDVLLMSATPIPRTLSQFIYGNLDCSIINEKPAIRKPIITTITNIKKAKTILEKIKNIKDKVYWVCPTIEMSVNNNLMSLEERFMMAKDILGEGCIKILHGKMNSDQKDCILEDFLNNKFRVLMSTTVIEVGIDIPDATIMVIENSECFGLAQLHQLRGRVGRGDKQSFCILLHNNDNENNAIERLRVMKESNDGFYIAEQDLKIRKGGDVIGIKQSGTPEFRFLDLFQHKNIISDTKLCADEFITNEYIHNTNINCNDPINILENIYKK